MSFLRRHSSALDPEKYRLSVHHITRILEEPLHNHLQKHKDYEQEKIEIEKKFIRINQYRAAFDNPQNLSELKEILSAIITSEKLRDQIRTSQQWIASLISEPSGFSHFLNYKFKTEHPPLPEALSFEDAANKKITPGTIEKRHMEKLQDHYFELIQNYINRDLLKEHISSKQISFLRNYYHPIIEKYIFDKMIESNEKNIELENEKKKITSYLSILSQTDDPQYTKSTLEQLEKHLISLTKSPSFSFSGKKALFTLQQVTEVMAALKTLYLEKNLGELLKKLEKIRITSIDRTPTGLYHALPNHFSSIPFELINSPDSNIRKYYEDQTETLTTLNESFLISGMDARLKVKRIELYNEEEEKKNELLFENLYTTLISQEKEDTPTIKSGAIKSYLSHFSLNHDDKNQIEALLNILLFQQPITPDLREECSTIENMLNKNEILYTQHLLEEHLSHRPDISNTSVTSLRARLFHEIMNLPEALHNRLEHLSLLKQELSNDNNFLLQINRPNLINQQLNDIDDHLKETEKSLAEQAQIIADKLLYLFKAQLFHAATLYYNRKISFSSHHDPKIEDPLILPCLKKIFLADTLSTVSDEISTLLEKYKGHGLHTNSLDTLLMSVLFNTSYPKGIFNITSADELAQTLAGYQLPSLHSLSVEEKDIKILLKKYFDVKEKTEIAGEIPESVRGKTRKAIVVREALLHLTKENIETLSSAVTHFLQTYNPNIKRQHAASAPNIATQQPAPTNKRQTL